MIYDLFYPLHTHELARLPERAALRAVPRARGDDDGDAAHVLAVPVVHPHAAEQADRPGRAQGRPGEPPVQGRHADDGRLADPARADLARPCSGPTRTTPWSGSSPRSPRCTARSATSTTTSRSSTSTAAACRCALKLLLQFPIAIGVCVYLFYGDDRACPATGSRCAIASRCRSSRSRSTRCRRCRAGRTWRSPRSIVVGMSNAVNLTDGLDGLAIGPVMINAGTYLIWSYLAGLTLFGLRHRALPRHPVDPQRERARGVLRRDDRRRHRLPLVQHLSRAGVHGRRRRARARRRARRDRDRAPRTSCCRCCSAASS